LFADRSGSPRAVIFDLDGTLTEPLLDFEAIRRELGIAPGRPILEALNDVDEPRRLWAEEILRRREMEAIEAATLADGCRELLTRLAQEGVSVAILTRNVRAAVRLFSERFGFRFDAVFTREDGPPKPSPHGVQTLCAAMGVAPADALVVGDYTFDILAGRAAGCRAVLVRAEPVANPEEWGSPDAIVPSLRSLLSLWPAP
jgi:HAD superfamily hydrolase (TIGR01509 family)